MCKIAFSFFLLVFVLCVWLRGNRAYDQYCLYQLEFAKNQIHILLDDKTYDDDGKPLDSKSIDLELLSPIPATEAAK